MLFFNCLLGMLGVMRELKDGRRSKDFDEVDR